MKTMTVPAVAALALATALVPGALATAAAPQDDPGQNVNEREHEARRPPAGPPEQASIGSACAAALSEAWEELGHFSDAMETWMLTTDVCSTSASPTGLLNKPM